jgi:hypothetical protein
VLGAAGPLLDAHGMADRFDADLVDRELARIGRGLDIGDALQVAFHSVILTSE